MFRVRGPGGTVGWDGRILSDPPDLHHPEPTEDSSDGDQPAAGDDQPDQ